MKAAEVDKALADKFAPERGRTPRLVFWHDAPGEFEEYVDAGIERALPGVTLLDLRVMGGWAAKLRLEREAPETRFLVYQTGAMPAPEHDWLLDIRSYSKTFHAEVASLWLQDLGLHAYALRDHLKRRTAFLRSQERRKKLKVLLTPDDDAPTIDRKMVAVLCGSAVATPYAMVRALCVGHADPSGGFALSTPPDAMQHMEKMGLDEVFWAVMEETFGFVHETPTVQRLLGRLLMTEFLTGTGVRIDALEHLRLPEEDLRPGQHARNAVVCLTQWRDSSGGAAAYAAVARAVETEHRVAEGLTALEVDRMVSSVTFACVEKHVLRSMVRQVTDPAPGQRSEDIQAVVVERQQGFWLRSGQMDQGEAMSAAYDAVLAAQRWMVLRNQYEEAFSYVDPQSMFDAYRDELYRFDRLYRDFHACAAPMLKRGGDLLKPLVERMEQLYANSYLIPLGNAWNHMLHQELLASWRLPHAINQQRFYASRVKPHLDKDSRYRAFVIISDGFRFDAGQELQERLTTSSVAVNVEMEAMLGVVPSCTWLGMASLLPHETLSMTAKGDVLADGHSTSGLEARNAQLGRYGGMACRASDLRAMKTDEARAFTRGKRVVYIYHDTIDAIGDKAPTEARTFDAVADCIQELEGLVQFCVSKLNAGRIFVTADHGFLFRMGSMQTTDKSDLNGKPPTAVRYKKRYVVGPLLGSAPTVLAGKMATTSGATGGMEFWVPPGPNRFNFISGARYVHGGAMPQEVVVPLLTVSRQRGAQDPKAQTAKVGLQVLGTRFKITAPVHRFEIIQTEKVGLLRQPITVSAAVYDGNRPVTSIDTLTFDSVSDSMDERKRMVRLTLGQGPFDKLTRYRFVLRDVENDAEVHAVDVDIDRSFDDDF